jgi:hypothetical protein
VTGRNSSAARIDEPGKLVARLLEIVVVDLETNSWTGCRFDPVENGIEFKMPNNIE